MTDCVRLQADAEEASVSSEMARSRLLVAQASLREHAVRWHEAEARARERASAQREGEGLEAPSPKT